MQDTINTHDPEKQNNNYNKSLFNDNDLNDPLINKNDQDTLNTKNEYNLTIKSSYNLIAKKLIYLASPILFMYVSHMIWSTLTYYNIRSRPVYITEGKSILFIYYYSIIIGLFWAFSIGFEIKGSKAFGEKNITELYRLISANFSMYVYIVIVLIIISNTLIPYLLTFLPFNSLSVSNFKSEMLLLSLTYPMIASIALLGRIVNMLQRNSILNYATFYSLIVQIFASWFFMNYLEMDNYGMGCAFLVTYFVKSFVIIKDVIKLEPHGIKLSKVNFFEFNIFKDNCYILKLIFFNLFPAFNCLIILISGEVCTFSGILIDDNTFTMLSIYFNIYNISALLFESIANSMTILISYSLGKKDEFLAWKIWKSCFRVFIPVAIGLTMLLYVFHIFIFKLYTNDISLNLLADYNCIYLCITIVLSGIHYLLSEFIIVSGYIKFPPLVALILRLGVFVALVIITVNYLNYNVNAILLSWICVQFLTLVIYTIKIYYIKKKGIILK